MHVNTVLEIGFEEEVEEEEEPSALGCFPRRPVLLFAAFLLIVGLALLGAYLGGALAAPPGNQVVHVLGENITYHSACWMASMDMGPDCP